MDVFPSRVSFLYFLVCVYAVGAGIILSSSRPTKLVVNHPARGALGRHRGFEWALVMYEVFQYYVYLLRFIGVP